MRLVLSTILMGLLSLASTGAFAQGPNPDDFYLNNITHNGTGCPINSVAMDVSEDAQAFTLLFSEYIAEAGPGIPFSFTRKNCNILLNLHVPQGWSFSIISLDYRGYAQLDYGTYGQQVAEYYFQGSQGPKFITTLYGQYANDYFKNNTIGVADAVWSPCGVNRALNIKTQVRVNARGSQRAMMTLDSIDGQMKQIYHMQWRRCRAY